MKKKLAFLRSSMALNIIGALMLIILLFGAVVSVLGFVNFTNAFKREYSVTTYHMADTAASLVNGEHLDEYLAGEMTEEYEKTKHVLDVYCHRINVSLIYVIQVDRSDYGRFVSIFNAVDNDVDDSSYTAWELGYQRNTTNDEYREKYRRLYEQETAFETLYRVKTTDGQHPHITTIVPVKDDSGEVAALLCVQRPVRELNDAFRPYLINNIISVVLMVILVAAFVSLYIRLQVVRPIRQVGTEAMRFARENTKGASLAEISKFNEIRRLAVSIDRMETDTLTYMQNLTAMTAEKQRIDTELQMAERIQRSMLPCIFPPYPERAEFDIFAMMDPAREVGGDFYDFFLIDDDHLCLVIADVSGKGVPAALFMMISKIIIQSIANLGRSPAEIMSKTNEMLSANNQMEMFVTAWVGILEISTGKLTAANAGHEFPALYRAKEGFTLFKDKHGFVLGGMPDLSFKDYELQLYPGDKIFVYTDGVPEATDAHNELFGTDRMLEALNRDRDADPKTVLDNVKNAVDAFVKDAEQFDDLTMLCMEYRGPKE